MNYSNVAQILEAIAIIFELFDLYGDKDYIGEEVTQLEHALQCAHQAEIEYPNKPEYILGALFHDIGHLISLRDSDLEAQGQTNFKYNNESLNGLGLVNHEEVGANFIEQMGFSRLVSSLGRYHVLTKRYLVTTNSDYYNNLSDASKDTFKLQGGALSDEEIANFEKMENHDLYIKMRSWDDRAKIVDFNYNHNLSYYENMAKELLLINEK